MPRFVEISPRCAFVKSYKTCEVSSRKPILGKFDTNHITGHFVFHLIINTQEMDMYRYNMNNMRMVCASREFKNNTSSHKDWSLKVLQRFGIIVKDQYSHLVYPDSMHQITNLWQFWLNWSSKLQDKRIMNQKTPLLHKQMCVLLYA